MEGNRKIETTRELQEIAYDGLKVLKRVCEAHGLMYMLCYGTLLGAVRHQGFIPWDDDIDVIMPRRDYEKLKRLDASEFGNVWKLYAYDTVPGFHQPFMKLCCTKTEKRPSPFESGLKYGISVDVFPYENLPAASEQEAIAKGAKLKQLKVSYRRLRHPFVSKRKGMSGKILKKVFRVQYKIMRIISPVEKAYKRLDRRWICEDEGTDYVAVFADGGPCNVWRRSDIIGKDGKVPQLLFEDELFNVPAEYKTILSGLFGNYMELPPVEKRVSGHTFEAYYID